MNFREQANDELLLENIIVGCSVSRFATFDEPERDPLHILFAR